MQERSITRKGELCIWESEGGYAPPDISIKSTTDAGSEITVEEMLRRLFPEMEMCGGQKGVHVIITIRVLQ